MLCSLLLVGCNRSLKIEKQVSIDPVFQTLVNDFVADGKANGRNIVIDNLIVRFTDKLTSETLGECFMYNGGQDGNPTILINYQDWIYETPTRQKVVFYHEMGHCVLFREHNVTYLPNGYVTSIMYPYIQWDDVYLNNWVWYMWELFNGH